MGKVWYRCPHRIQDTQAQEQITLRGRDNSTIVFLVVLASANKSVNAASPEIEKGVRLLNEARAHWNVAHIAFVFIESTGAHFWVFENTNHRIDDLSTFRRRSTDQASDVR